MMDKTQYTISNLAQEFDISTRTIRFYEDKDILKPERSGQKRIYSAKDRTLLKLILRGKRLGFSLDECKELLDLYDPFTENNHSQLNTCLQKFTERKEQLHNQMKDIKKMLGELNNAITRINGALTQKE